MVYHRVRNDEADISRWKNMSSLWQIKNMCQEIDAEISKRIKSRWKEDGLKAKLKNTLSVNLRFCSEAKPGYPE